MSNQARRGVWRGLSAMPPKLILHFDVNETILVGDPAGGDTFEQSLNKIICKTALVQRSGIDTGSGMPTRWRDGSEICSSTTFPPPLFTGFDWPEDTVSFYRAGTSAKACAQQFTEPGQPGEAYRPLYNKLEAALRWPAIEAASPPSSAEAAAAAVATRTPRAPPPKRLCHDGVHHFLIPAFFTTICELAKMGRTFGIVVRTFGTDADDVVAALQAYAEGVHLPEFNDPVVSEMSLAAMSCWKGAYTQEGTFCLKRLNSSGRSEIISDEDKIVRILHGEPNQITCVVCTDDYGWWKDHGYAPFAGKPIWLDYTKPQHNFLPIFFDDNIHNDADDSIVAVRSKRIQGGSTLASCYEAMNGEETLLEQGVHLVRVPTVEPVLNQRWFLEQITRCEAAWATRVGEMERSGKM